MINGYLYIAHDHYDRLLVSATSYRDTKGASNALEHGANVDASTGREADSNTPLIIAAEENDVETMRLLLSHNANMHIQNDQGVTALTAAMTIQANAAAKLLLEQGAERSLLHRAAVMDDVVEIERLLIQNNNVDAQDETGSTPLLLAALTGRDKAVRLLLSRSANPNIADHLGFTPLYQACRFGYPTIVYDLLHHGADQNMKPYNTKFSASDIAQIYCNWKVGDVLRDYKGDQKFIPR